MKLVFYSQNGNISGLAYRCKDNHDVYLYIKNEAYTDIMDGIINKVYTLHDIYKIKPDVVVFDGSGMADDALKLNKLGFKTINACTLFDMLASDNTLTPKLAKDLKIPIADSSIHAPCIEIDTEVAFQAGKPLFPAIGSIKTRHFMAGGMGKITDCQASMTWIYDKKEPRLVQLFKKFWLLVSEMGYSGHFGIRCILDKQGKIWFKEFIKPLNYSAFYGFCSLLDIDPAEYCLNVAQGTLHALPVRLNEVAYSVNLSVYPYPCPNRVELSRIKGAIFNYPDKYKDNVWLGDIMKDETYSNMVVAGTSGQVATITFTGKEHYKLDNSIGNVVQEIDLVNKQYRTDSIYKIMSDYMILKKRGII